MLEMFGSDQDEIWFKHFNKKKKLKVKKIAFNKNIKTIFDYKNQQETHISTKVGSDIDLIDNKIL